MADSNPRLPTGVARWPCLPLLLTALAAWSLQPGRLAAQLLPLKEGAPRAGALQCPSQPSADPATPEERAQAAELGASAAQAVILGEVERARQLLARATDLDPRSATLAYQYGRVLEEDEELAAAVDAYCRVLALDASQADADDARLRIEALGRREREALPEEALAAFRVGVARAEAGELPVALASFERAVRAAPGWADAIYNRGVVRVRSGDREGALEDLRRYLELRPDAPDAIAVSERIGQLGTPTSLPSPGATLALGLLPGAGHFYSGRPVAGIGVLALVGGAVAAGLLVEDVEVLCLTDPGPGGDCPPGQVLDETRDRPYLVAGVGAAAAITVIGAIEAFLSVRGRRDDTGGPLRPVQVGGVTLGGLDAVAAPDGRVELRFLQIRH